MKTQNKVLLAGLAMSLVMATGCKNSSLSAEERVQNSPEPAFVARDAEAAAARAEALEMAPVYKENHTAAIEKLLQNTAELKEAIVKRDELMDAREAETNSVVSEILSSQVESAISKVQSLEKNVEMAKDLVAAERAVLNSALEKLTETERAKIGESTDVEYQMGFNEEKARREMALEAQRESVAAADARVQDLNVRLVEAEEQLAKIEAAADQIPHLIVLNERKQMEALLKDVEKANSDLKVEVAKEDNLVKLFNEMSL